MKLDPQFKGYDKRYKQSLKQADEKELTMI